MYVYVCVVGFGVWTVSVSVCLVCYSLAGRRCRELPAGPGGLPRTPLFQLYVRCAGPCRARGGSRAPVSVHGASVAQGAV